MPALASNHDAEQAVIGAMLTDSSVLDRADLSPEDFHTPIHRAAWASALRLAAESKPVDVVTLSEHLSSHPEGLAYLSEVAWNTPGSSNAAAYAAIVREKAHIRKTLGALHEAIDTLADGGQPDAVIAELLGRYEGLRTEGDGALAWTDVLQRSIDFMDRAGETTLGVPTGLPELDTLTGGLHGPRLWVVAARPGNGKTALTQQWALHAASLGKRVGVCSLEMSAEELGIRSLANRSGQNVSELFCGDIQAAAKSIPSASEMAQYGMWVDDSTYSLSGVLARISAWKREHDIDFAVVDHIGLVEADGNTRNDEVSKVSRSLKKLAKRLDIPVVAVSQLNRGNEREKRKPALSDLRDSGGIEQDADFCLFIHAGDAMGHVVPCELGLLKTRTGRRGWLNYGYQFDGRTQRFSQNEWPTP